MSRRRHVETHEGSDGEPEEVRRWRRQQPQQLNGPSSSGGGSSSDGGDESPSSSSGGGEDGEQQQQWGRGPPPPRRAAAGSDDDGDDDSDSESDNDGDDAGSSGSDGDDDSDGGGGGHGRGRRRDGDARALGQRAAELQQQLADVPFEVLERLQQDGRGPTGAAAAAAARAAKQQARSFHRETKNRPTEQSSRRPVSRFREVLQVPKQPSTDPRFEQSGVGGKAFSRDAFAKRYAFLYDDVLPAERATLKDALKRERREGRRRELQAQLTRVQQQLTDERVRRRALAMEQDWKQREKAAVQGGKAPFFAGKAEKRRRELVAKYEELKAQGRLETFMAKRRRKNAAKDHRYVPSGRRGGGGGE